jgi:hypothetical protein
MSQQVVKLLQAGVMQIRVELVTPDLAAKYINQNTSNRSLREGVVEAYSSDMMAGRWTECVDPIVFYDDKSFANGQHRLYAIVESSMPQTFIVVENLPRSAGLNIDAGLARTLVDNARISGADICLSNELVSVARGIEDGDSDSMRNRKRSYAERLEVTQKHRDAAEWVVKNGPHTRGMRNAAVMAALGRAWYLEADKMLLKRFVEVLDKGMSEGRSESAAVTMRNYIIAVLQNGLTIAHSKVWRENFIKVQNAIKYFMLGRPLLQIRKQLDEQYPLPGAGNPRRHKPTTQRGRRAVTKAATALKKQ